LARALAEFFNGVVKRPTMVDALLRIRGDLMKGRIAMHLGEANVAVMEGFIAGYLACLSDQGVEDGEYEEFREWLREVKRAFPQEGWAASYLRECHGDHHAAIQRLLDFVAEFAALKRATAPGA
jgi:hypothetical protein